MPTMSIVEKFTNLDAGDFRGEVQQLWDALDIYRETTVNLVTDRKITPVQGCGILACASGQLFGYQAFHGQTTPSELISALSSSRS